MCVCCVLCGGVELTVNFEQCMACTSDIEGRQDHWILRITRYEKGAQEVITPPTTYPPPTTLHNCLIILLIGLITVDVWPEMGGTLGHKGI